MRGNRTSYLRHVTLIARGESESPIYKIYKIDYKKGKENWEFRRSSESFYVSSHKKKNQTNN